MDVSIPHDPATAADEVRLLALGELGFGLVGICDARPSGHAEHVRAWVAAGRHGEMHYVADHLDVRLDPARLLEGTATVIVVADRYASDVRDGRAEPQTAGRIARYAWGDDYHKVLKKRLHGLENALRARFPGHAFRSAVDTAPILEREHAGRAGLGWQAKNTMLIHPRHGSYLLLGALVTTLPLEPTRREPARDHCGTCTRCIDACPTGCITSDPRPGSPGGRHLDATRCISYLTLEHRSAIDPALHQAMGQWIAGCDVCQEVCPYNHDALPLPIHPRYAPRERFAEGLPLLEVLGWTEEDRRVAFVSSALKRVKLEMLRRNALIAAGNAIADEDDPALLARVHAIAVDPAESPLIRDTARAVLRRLAETAASAPRPT